MESPQLDVDARERLIELRRRPEYQRVWEQGNPLVTIRIATYNRARVLVDRALKSVLDQTHQNFEVRVVGDRCTDNTEELVQSIGDSRIYFHHLEHRQPYPANARDRWMVAGSPAMNMGARLAEGTWIAPLDDDDAFTNDHVERLLQLALETRSELAYGALRQVNQVTKAELELWSYPPEHGKFGFQGALYLRLLNFLEYDHNSWKVKEPGDWNLCRRMQEAGVRMTSTPEVVTTLFFTHPDQKGTDC